MTGRPALRPGRLHAQPRRRAVDGRQRAEQTATAGFPPKRRRAHESIIRADIDHATLRCPLLKPKLHQIGIERGERAFERAGELFHGLRGGIGDSGARCRIGKPGAQTRRQSLFVGDQFRAMRFVERRVDFGKIPNMRTMQYGGA